MKSWFDFQKMKGDDEILCDHMERVWMGKIYPTLESQGSG